MAKRKQNNSTAKFTYKLPLTVSKQITHKYYGVSDFNTCHRQDTDGEWREATNALFTEIKLYKQKIFKVSINPALKKLRRKFKAAKLQFTESIFIENNKKWVLIQNAI